MTATTRPTTKASDESSRELQRSRSIKCHSVCSKLDDNSCCVGLQQTTPMTEPAMTPGDAAPLEEPVTARDGPEGEEGRVEVGVGVGVKNGVEVGVEVEIGVGVRVELGVGGRRDLPYKSTTFDRPPAVSLIRRQPAAAQKQASNKRDT
jgi:hypothetical protein